MMWTNCSCSRNLVEEEDLHLPNCPVYKLQGEEEKIGPATAKVQYTPWTQEASGESYKSHRNTMAVLWINCPHCGSKYELPIG